MTSRRKFYRTVIQVEVLSEEPYHCGNLKRIDQDISDGDCSGRLSEVVRNEVVDGPAMAKLLQAQGSDPGFFRLDDEGNDTDDESLSPQYKRVFIVTPTRDQDTLYEVCGTDAEGTLDDIYMTDEFDHIEGFIAEAEARAWVKVNYGLDDVQTV